MFAQKILYGVALLPLLTGMALAEPSQTSRDSLAPAHQVARPDRQKTSPAKQPMRLSEQQMDKVTAGMIMGVTGVMIWYPGRLPSDPVLWPNGVPSCQTGPACL